MGDMAFNTSYDTSPPSTPDKPRNLATNLSTTPAGPPPSSAASFTPLGPPPSTVFDSSQLGSRSRLGFSENVFDQSLNSQTSEDLLSFSTTSDFPLPLTQSGSFSNTFGSRNTFTAPGSSQSHVSNDHGHGVEN